MGMKIIIEFTSDIGREDIDEFFKTDNEYEKLQMLNSCIKSYEYFYPFCSECLKCRDKKEGNHYEKNQNNNRIS